MVSKHCFGALAIFMAMLLASCEKLSVSDSLTDDELGTRSKSSYATYAGQTLVSGQPIPAYVENGIAPVAFEKSISIHITGYTYKSSDKYPDLFFEHNSGSAVGKTLRYYKFNSLSKDGRLVFHSPVGVQAYPWSEIRKRTIVRDVNNVTYAILVSSSNLSVSLWDEAGSTFGSNWVKTIPLSGLPSNPASIDAIYDGQGTMTFYCIVGDGTGYDEDQSADFPERGYYDALGMWRGAIGNSKVYRFKLDVSTWKTEDATLLLGSEVVRMPYSICVFKDPSSGRQGVIVGGKFGSLKYIDDNNPSESFPLTDGHDNAVIYSGINHRMMTLGSKDNKTYTDFIVTGEGAPYHFQFTGKYDSNGCPIFGSEKYVLQLNGNLYGSSLTVPTVVDWDRDGVLDIIVGNSDGCILFYKNYASDQKPAFGDPVFLESCGEKVHFRGGYYEVQGPDDGGAWGYICPNVIDWNEDGIPDIVTSSNIGNVEIMLGTGKEGADCLGPRQTVLIDGMELYGMWRVRPGVAKVGKELWLVFMDGDDALHLYKKTSNTGVRDCGKLLMTDGKQMTGHFPLAGRTSMGYQGREKIEICDWDNDGDMDLLVAGPKNMSMPDETTGYPYHGNVTQLHAVFVENVGSNDAPVFKRPRQLIYKNMSTSMNLGGHAQSISACNLGDTSVGLNIVLGCEGGLLWYFKHEDIVYNGN